MCVPYYKGLKGVLVRIELNRSENPALLMCGVKCGIHWQAVLDINPFADDDFRSVYCVFLQFFIDAAAFGVVNAHTSINGIPAPHNRTIMDDVLVVGLVAEEYGGAPPQHRLQWVDVYYGKLIRSNRRKTYVGANMLAGWYPRKTAFRYVSVLPKTFFKYIRPSAEYMCNYLDLVQNTPVVS